MPTPAPQPAFANTQTILERFSALNLSIHCSANLAKAWNSDGSDLPYCVLEKLAKSLQEKMSAVITCFPFSCLCFLGLVSAGLDSFWRPGPWNISQMTVPDFSRCSRLFRVLLHWFRSGFGSFQLPGSPQNEAHLFGGSGRRH